MAIKIEAAARLKATDNPYGQCPECGEEGVMTERRVNGNSICANNHSYPRPSVKAELSFNVKAGWFSQLTPAERKAYLKEHPNSKMIQDDNGDAERVQQLKTQIKDLEQDVKEIEADGDDAGVEKKHLNSLRAELVSLT